MDRGQIPRARKVHYPCDCCVVGKKDGSTAPKTTRGKGGRHIPSGSLRKRGGSQAEQPRVRGNKRWSLSKNQRKGEENEYTGEKEMKQNEN